VEVYLCCESLPRIAYVSLPAEQMFLSFPLGAASLISDGLVLRNGDVVLHGLGQRTHQRSNDACRWGLISLSPARSANCSKTLTGQIAPSHAGRILRPAHAEVLRFQRLLAQACSLAEAARHESIDRPEAARALEQELLHAIINCLAANEMDDSPRTRLHHGAVMVRFEELLGKRIGQRLNVPALCAEISVPERTLRMCCAEFLGVGPARYLLLQRLNKARAALQRADPKTTSVAEVARNHQFVELGALR
jgi:AraC-like DNA-binding protein